MQQKNIALVTGSSSGIGFHTSLFLARAGFYTYATMRNLGKSSTIIDIAREDTLTIVLCLVEINTPINGYIWTMQIYRFNTTSFELLPIYVITVKDTYCRY